MAPLKTSPTKNVWMMLSLPVVALCFLTLPGVSNGRTSATVGLRKPAAPPPVAFDVCITDGSTHDTLQFSSSTGLYLFTRCKDGFSLTGTGTVRKSGSVIVLNDTKPDRLINAHFLTNQKTGKATVVRVLGGGAFQTIHIVQTNPSTPCGCGV